eukprot:5808058-Alexandrium_andersonii.AAC.1
MLRTPEAVVHVRQFKLRALAVWSQHWQIYFQRATCTRFTNDNLIAPTSALPNTAKLLQSFGVGDVVDCPKASLTAPSSAA